MVDLLSLGFATRYMRRMFADREHIREAIINPGGSIILAGVNRNLEGTDEYSSQLGNDYHLDLIQAELEITNNCVYPGDDKHPPCSELPRFTAKQIAALMSWSAALDPEEASKSGLLTQSPGALRRTRHYAVAKVTKRMTDG